MSNYDPYRFLPNNQPPPSSSIEQIHIPVYAAPDLDPSRPLPGAKSSHTRESHQDMAEQSEAGPSRKRPREAEGNGGNGHGHGIAPSNGHGQGHNGGGAARRPVEVPPSMFGFDARNDLTREIGTWLVKTCQGRENIEVSRIATQSESVLIVGRDQARTNRPPSPLT
jgi:hypothetical protein